MPAHRKIHGPIDLGFTESIRRMCGSLYLTESVVAMRGATLIEVVVAGFLLALFLLFSIQPLVTSNSATQLNLMRQTRDALAAQLLERAMLCSYKDLRTESGAGFPSAETGKDQSALTWQIEVEESDEWLGVAVKVEDLTTGEVTNLQSSRIRTAERVDE